MPNICCAVGCKTNYKSKISSQSNDISIHSFPKDHRFKEWYRRVKRDDQEFTEEKARKSKLCSLHFTEDDFVEESVDTNTARKSRRFSKLTRRILRKSAIPSLFPSIHENNGHLNSSLSMSEYSRGPYSPVESFQGDDHQYGFTSLLIEDYNCFRSTDDFLEQLKIETLPEDFHYSASCLTFYIVDLSCYCPSISLSVRVTNDFSVEIFVRGELVHPTHYAHILNNGKITHMTQFINLLHEAKGWICSPPQTDPITSAIMHLKVQADFSKFLGDKDAADTTEFFIDQLSCLQNTYKPRKYSSGLLVNLSSHGL